VTTFLSPLSRESLSLLKKVSSVRFYFKISPRDTTNSTTRKRNTRIRLSDDPSNASRPPSPPAKPAAQQRGRRPNVAPTRRARSLVFQPRPTGAEGKIRRRRQPAEQLTLTGSGSGVSSERETLN
jgi:hypothetical protein